MGFRVTLIISAPEELKFAQHEAKGKIFVPKSLS